MEMILNLNYNKIMRK